MPALKPILALDTGMKLASRLKPCYISALIECSSAIGWATIHSNDKTVSFSLPYKKTDNEKGPVITQYNLWRSTKSVV